MKISVTLKDPDGFCESVEEDVKASLSDLGLDASEVDALVEKRTENVWKQLEKWVEYQEYITIEFDLKAGTATVKERK